jgi:integrase
LSKKRGNGEGSIHRRKGGGWCAQYTVYTAKGRKRKSLYGTTRAEVAKKLAKALSDREGGVAFDAKNLMLGEYLDLWLRDSVKDTVRLTTYQGYERIVRLHIKPTLARVKLENLTPTHLRGLYRERLGSGLSPRMVQLIHTTLHKALEQAVADGLVPRNVAGMVRAPKSPGREIKTLVPEQARALLRSAHTYRLEALFVLAITTGMRQGELLGLKWADVDMETGILQVRRTLSTATGKGFSFNAPKTAKGRRSIKLPESALSSLRRHREAQEREIEKISGLWQNHDLVFTTHFGTPISRQDLITRSFKPLLQHAGLPNIRFHDLRHTCATLLLGRGVHAKLVQELLGHATISVTLDTYSHVLPSMTYQTATTMEDVFS